MTPFVTVLAEPFLQYMNMSLIDYGHPRGLISLILVSVSLLLLQAVHRCDKVMQLECTVRAFEKTGEYEDPGPFTADQKALLTEYLDSIDKFSGWEEFYKACKFTNRSLQPDEDDVPSGVDISQVDIGRRDLVFSSSPVRA